MIEFDKVLKVGKVDRYSITINKEWLDDETLSVGSVVVDELQVTAGTVDLIGDKLSVPLTGVAVGYTIIEFNYSTVTRTDCFKALLKIEDC